ncbi:MAG: hypothetical protein KY395_00915 [Actinobacteria bacterium]|nr:hypothetical protein [Actinomycetota bacterium]
MRSRLTVISALLGIALIGSLVAGPAQAAEKEVEGTIPAFAPAIGPVGGSVHGDKVCAGDLPAEGPYWKWIDLEEEYKKFDLSGPAHLVASGDTPAGVGDHDLDWYFYDAKCKNVTTHTNVEDSNIKAEARRPAKFVLVLYWAGIYPNIPFKIIASN